MYKRNSFFTKCGHCGSYVPKEWARCGRCGSLNIERRSGKKWAWILLFLIIAAGAYIHKDRLFSLVSGKSPGITMKTPDKGISEILPDTEYLTPEGENGIIHTNIPQNTEPLSEPYNIKHSSINEEAIYDIIHKELREASESVMLPVGGTEFNSEQIFKTIRQILADDPAILFYDGCTYRSDGLLTFKYSKSGDFILKASEEVRNKSDEILSEIIFPGMTDFDKELAIHNYVVQNCRYDFESLKKDEIPPESHNAYGPLVLGRAVCEGYAKAIKLLLDGAGIDSILISGSSKGASHAWNLVKIGGSFYHLDATWDDPIMPDDEQIIQYSYFNLNDKDIRKDHLWEEDKYPECSDNKYNYYFYFDLVLDSFDKALEKMVYLAGSRDGTASIRITDYSSEAYSIQKLIEQAAVQLNALNVTYSVNEQFGVIDAWFSNQAGQ